MGNLPDLPPKGIFIYIDARAEDFVDLPEQGIVGQNFNLKDQTKQNEVLYQSKMRKLEELTESNFIEKTIVHKEEIVIKPQSLPPDNLGQGGWQKYKENPK